MVVVVVIVAAAAVAAPSGGSGRVIGNALALADRAMDCTTACAIIAAPIAYIEVKQLMWLNEVELRA